MAYVLGFIFADGAIQDVQKSSRTCYLTLSSNDKSILEQIRKVLGSKHKIYIRKPHFTTFPNGKYLSKEHFILRIGSKLLYNDLLKFGLTPRKSLTIKFPKIPDKYLSYYLRGYFDGDGCLHLKKHLYPIVVFTSGSSKFLKGLSLNLQKAGVAPVKEITINNYGSSAYFQLRYGTQDSYNILKYMYSNLEESPFLERKYFIYRKYLEIPHRALKSNSCFYSSK